MKKAVKGLTELEQEVMKVLWDNERGMTNSEIADCLKDEGISAASVAQVMKRLLAKEAVKVGEHILVSNVYARTFCPCISREEFIREELERLSSSAFFSKKKGIKGMVVGLLQSDSEGELNEEDIEELEKFLEAKKAVLKKER